MVDSGGNSIFAHYVFNARDGSWYEPGKWEEHWSETWNCPCYFNIETGEMVWTLSDVSGAPVKVACSQTSPHGSTDTSETAANETDTPAELSPQRAETASHGEPDSEAECDAWIAEDVVSAVGSDTEAEPEAEAGERPARELEKRPVPPAPPADSRRGGGMSKDLSFALSRCLARTEPTRQTVESRPAVSKADRHLQGLSFDAPPVKDWLKQFADPEEDRVGEVLACDLEERGPRPAHAPKRETAEEKARLAELTQLVWGLRDQLATERRQAEQRGQRQEALARRELEVQAQERALAAEREKLRVRAEERRSYPTPPWLPEPDGTINVGVVGNSGVGKSLLINQLRGLSHGMDGWAPVGINETTVKVSMYAFPSEHRVRLWDFPGAGTPDFPLETYVARMGLRYLDQVLIVTAGRFTETEVELMCHLKECRVPHCMVRTKVDIDVWNNRYDNRVDEEASLHEIREDLRRNHGIEDVFLVSLRDTGAHDFPRLLSAVFPRLGALREGSSEVQGWDSAWAIPDVYSEMVSAIQGRWKDKQGTLYIVQGLQVHVTAAAGRATESNATAMLTEADGRVYWLCRWAVGSDSVARSRRRGELQWEACEETLSDMVWKWHD